MDNIISDFGNQLFTSQRYFSGATSPDAAEPAVLTRRRTQRRAGWSKLGFDPLGAPKFMPDDAGTHPALSGLWYREGQSFGVELELTRDDFTEEMPEAAWVPTAEQIRMALEEALPGRVAAHSLPEYGSDKDHELWNVERDNSAGWEVTSRVLVNREGFEELARACEALEAVSKRLNLKVNYRTGLHVHIGWLGKGAKDLRAALMLARLFEPALATLVAPSRIASYASGTYDLDSPNQYCAPVASVFKEEVLGGGQTAKDLLDLCSEHEARYVTFNIKPLENIHTVEVRLHSGTTDVAKIALWISLWQQILWRAANGEPVEATPDREVIVPDGDIVELARRYLPDGRDERFLKRLDQRRRAVAETWAKHVDLQTWLDYSTRWEAIA